MVWRAGEKVGQYEIISELGRGGMATVYKAHHTHLDRIVAIKVMHQSYADDNNFIERFNREARIVANLEHPHIVPVFDYNEYNGMPYLVMKFVQGRSLKELLIKRPPSLDQIIHIMTAIGKATTYAHSKGVLHRDIKPSNIIIDSENIPYLADFGLARIAAAGESTMSADVLLGTPYYMSPEQAKGVKDLDHRSDLYSLGIVLYELVVGQVPFSSPTPLAVIQDHINTPLPRPSQINPDTPPQIEAVLRKALAKSPDARYGSADEMMIDFAQAVENEGLSELAEDRKNVADDSLARWRSAYIKHTEEKQLRHNTIDEADSLAGPIRNLASPSIIEDIQGDSQVYNFESASIKHQTSNYIPQPKPKNEVITSTLVRHEPNSRFWIMLGVGIILLSLFLIVAVILNTSNTFLEMAEIVQDIETVTTCKQTPTGLLSELPQVLDDRANINNNALPYLNRACQQYNNGEMITARRTLQTGYEFAGDKLRYLANSVTIADSAQDRTGAIAYGILFWEMTVDSEIEQDQTANIIMTRYLYEQSLEAEDIHMPRAVNNSSRFSEFLPDGVAQAIIRSPISHILLTNHYVENERAGLAKVVIDTWDEATHNLLIGKLVEARYNMLISQKDIAKTLLNELVETSTTPAWIVTIAQDLLIDIEE